MTHPPIAYTSTRGRIRGQGFEDVLLAGLAADGGLFVPEAWPSLGIDALRALDGVPYADTAAAVMAPFTAGCFDEAELRDMARDAYAGFAHPATAPLKQLDHDTWLMELFHGPTLAFKDFALQLLGRMFDRVLERRGERITIVGATSGDTGSAAIHATRGRDNVRIAILHPHGRTSEVQRRQMTCVADANVLNVAVKGDFDDCQALVKALFVDEPFRDSMRLAAINSINWARVMAQAAYYVHAALRLGGLERPVSFAVPTGNFGDVYAGHVASRLGLPLGRLLVATNRNDILARFLDDGVYAARRVDPTMSPSMDIQVASNFERLLFETGGCDGDATAAMMQGFKENRRLAVEGEALRRIQSAFVGAAVDEDETARTIRDAYARMGELLDPHTAVGVAAASRRRADLPGPVVCLATAHPAKFPDAVKKAAGVAPPRPVRLDAMLEGDERMVVLDNDLDALKALLIERLGTP
ncbi:MAG: threonine synthase [Geminicoccaceae bacterium]|nr:threonine synthase [Geminicoccaceae bacterium]